MDTKNQDSVRKAIKLVLLGDSGVGKSSLLTKFVGRELSVE